MPDIKSTNTALVLGGGSDIATAILVAAAGSGLQKVVLAARRPEEASDAVGKALPAVSVDAVRWDALEIDSHTGMLDRAFEALGTVDLVICGVGMLGHHAGLSMDAEGVDLMVRSNFSGPASALAELAPRMVSQGSGTIVVLSSVAAMRARKSNYVYGSSKAGLDTFAQGMGDALKGTGVNVLVVRPGFVSTKMTEGLDPAPFSTDAAAVGERVMKAVAANKETVTSPALLTPVFGVLRNTPRSVWRRIAADR